MDLSNIINELKSKKELKNLDDNFIKNRIKEYLAKNKVYLSNKRSKSYELMFEFDKIFNILDLK